MPERRSTRRSGTPARVRTGQTSPTSVVRCAVALLLVLLGIAWIVVYVVTAGPSASGAPPSWLGWMADLGRWNYLIGFGLIFVGLGVAAAPTTPLGRGQGVVVGMLGCFVLGLAWIVAYYVLGQNTNVPVLTELSQYNLVVGIGFMAVGFVYATHWE